MLQLPTKAIITIQNLHLSILKHFTHTIKMYMQAMNHNSLKDFFIEKTAVLFRFV
jgi:hypothetical protein